MADYEKEHQPLTYFASPERLSIEKIHDQVQKVENNPLVDGLMKAASGLFAVLNEHRQLLSVNEAYIQLLGVPDLKNLLGLRVGETVGCIHAHDMPAGCGTSEYCSTCGAAIAMVSAISDNKLNENKCAITAIQNGIKKDLYFAIRALPITIEDQTFILIFLQDISKEQEYANLEKIFFHDLNNLIFGISGRAELLLNEKLKDREKVARDIFQLSQRLSQEITIQKMLFQSGIDECKLIHSITTVRAILTEVANFFKNHNVAKDKQLKLPDDIPDMSFSTDTSVLIRVLSNMLTNAFEATDEGDFVLLTVDNRDSKITFGVWNRRAINPDVSKRIFQRNFSTKKSRGRGLGTYSIKLLGERVLGGSVEFTSSAQEGTWFRFSLPVE